MKHLYSLFIFLLSCYLVQSQDDKLNLNDLSGSKWNQCKIENGDTIKILTETKNCSIPVILEFNREIESFKFNVFRKELTLFDLGNYDLFFCSFDPESYAETIELNSCPDIVSAKIGNKKIWYFINQSLPRKKYRLIFYQKDDIIILKGKRKEKGKILIFKKDV